MCGTLRANRGVTDFLKNVRLGIEQLVFQRKGEILLEVWKNYKKKVVKMISTIHNSSMIETGKINYKTGNPINKPATVMDYNKYMSGVDLADQYLSYYPIFRKSMKWTKKVMFYLMHCAMFNSFRVYQHLNPDKKKKFHDYMLEIAKSWIESEPNQSDDPDVIDVNRPSTSTRAPHFDPVNRLSKSMKDHHPIQIRENGKILRRRCRVCSKHGIRKETSYMCQSCKVPLHLEKCFQDFHLKKKY